MEPEKWMVWKMMEIFIWGPRKEAYLSGAHPVVREFPEAFKGAAMLVKERADNAVHQERLKGFLREQGTESPTFQKLRKPVSFLRFESFK